MFRIAGSNGLSAGRGQRLPHFSRGSRLGAVLAHHAHGLFNQFEVARLSAERRILESDGTWPPRRTVSPIKGRISALTPAIIQGAPGASSSNSDK